MEALGLCKPATAILLISVAGAIYHLVTGAYHVVLMWLLIALFGTGIFQGLCYGGLEPIAWTLMLIPVLIVCFFLAVALFASSMRIESINKLPCGRCHRRHEGRCPRHERPRCNRAPKCGGCNQCQGFIGDDDDEEVLEVQE